MIADAGNLCHCCTNKTHVCPDPFWKPVMPSSGYSAEVGAVDGGHGFCPPGLRNQCRSDSGNSN